MPQSMPSPEISPRLATLCSWACVLVAIGMPIFMVVQWITYQTPSYWEQTLGPPPEHLRPLGAALAVIPWLLLARGLWLARRCLTRFGRGEFFSAAAISSLRGFGRWSFMAGIAGLLAPTVIVLALTIANPPGHRELAVGVTLEEGLILILAGVAWIVAGALARAAQVADENRQFV